MLYQKNLKIIFVIGISFYYLQLITLYIVIFYRLYYTFKNDDSLQLNICTRCFIIFLIIITSIGMLTYCIFFITFNPNNPSLLQHASILSTFFMILNISMLTLFICKLQRIIDNQSIGQINNGNIILNKPQTKLISVITKTTLLSSIVIVFNQLYFIAVLIGNEISKRDNHNDNVVELYFVVFTFGIMAIQCTLNSTILYLNFAFNSKSYNKICSICHNGCYRCFYNMTKKRIRRKSVRINDLGISIIDKNVTDR